MQYSTRPQAEWNIAIPRVVINLISNTAEVQYLFYYIYYTCIQNGVRSMKTETKHSSKTTLRYQRRNATTSVFSRVTIERAIYQLSLLPYNTMHYHMSKMNAWESMGKPCSCIKSRIFYCKSHENLYQYYKSHENLYQVLQVTCAASECAMKSKVHMIKSL